MHDRLDPSALAGVEEGADEDDDAVPDLVDNFEAVSTEVRLVGDGRAYVRGVMDGGCLTGDACRPDFLDGRFALC